MTPNCDKSFSPEGTPQDSNNTYIEMPNKTCFSAAMVYITYTFTNCHLIQFLHRGKNRFSVKNHIVFQFFNTDN